MSARLYALRGHRVAELPPEPVPFQSLCTDQHLVAVDTRRLRYVPPESPDAEERRRIAVRAIGAEHARLERTKWRRRAFYLVASLVVVCLAIAASHAHPEPWLYGWHP